MIIIIMHIEDFSLSHGINERLSVTSATYVPSVGEHISLSSKQETDLEHRILMSPYLKKAYMQYVMRHGRKPLKPKEYKNLTPADIRKNILSDSVNWKVFIPPTLKVVGKTVMLHEHSTRISLDVKFSEEFSQRIVNR